MTVEVAGRRIEVVLPAGLGAAAAAGPRPSRPKRRAGSAGGGTAAGGDALTSPMQGTIVKVAVDEGQQVAEGDLVVVLEAMKMEQPLNAHKAGTITDLQAEAGAARHRRRGDLHDHRLTSHPTWPVLRSQVIRPCWNLTRRPTSIRRTSVVG